MSLTRKRKFSEKGREAVRRNGRRSRGPVAPQGKAHSAAANLRHGYYSKAAQVALAALGEDPAEFRRPLDSLIHTYEPAGALEMGLVMEMARAVWRMDRFHRMAESIAITHLKQARKNKEIREAFLLMPVFQKIERLKELYKATCMGLDPVVGPAEMQLFEKCRGDLPAEKAEEVLALLLRLRKPGPAEDLGLEAKRLHAGAEIPAAEGEERKVVWRKLVAVLARQIEPLEKHILGYDRDPDQAEIDRDKLLAEAQAKAALMNRGQESSLRQLWRTTNLLLKIQKMAKEQRDVKNEG